MFDIQKLFGKSIILNLVILIAVLFAAQKLYTYITDKGVVGYEGNASMVSATSVIPSDPPGEQQFATVDGHSDQISGTVSSQNAEDLLPHDDNNQWSDLKPTGLQGVQLLQAGRHIGSISQPKRLMNLQMRAEFPNPTTGNTGIWNQSIIERDVENEQIGYNALSA